MSFGIADLSNPSTVLPRVKKLENNNTTAALLSRDALQHLSYRAIANAFKVYCGSDVDWLLLGSYVVSGLNHDIGRDRRKKCNLGSFFAINLRAPPFFMGEPHLVLREYDYNSYAKKKEPRPQDNKYLLLYNRTEVCSPEGGMARYAKCFGVTIPSQKNVASTTFTTGSTTWDPHPSSPSRSANNKEEEEKPTPQSPAKKGLRGGTPSTPG
jgi:hypothetical protein